MSTDQLGQKGEIEDGGHMVEVEKGPRWSIKPESLVTSNGAEVTLGIAYGPVPETETMVCPVAEMITVRAELASVRRDAEYLKGQMAKVDGVRESAQEMLLMARSFLRVCEEMESTVTRRQAYYELSTACGWMQEALDVV